MSPFRLRGDGFRTAFRSEFRRSSRTTRRGYGKVGDAVAVQHIALLGEGHCIELIQQLVTGLTDTSSATVSAEPDIAAVNMAGDDTNAPGISGSAVTIAVVVSICPVAV